MRLKKDKYPFFAADGRSLGYRTREAVEQLLAGGFVTASLGPKGHLRAIHVRKEDGSHPVETQPRAGTKYSFQQHLASGHRCWKLKKLDLVDEDGVRFSTAGIYQRVLFDCLPK